MLDRDKRVYSGGDSRGVIVLVERAWNALPALVEHTGHGNIFKRPYAGPGVGLRCQRKQIQGASAILLAQPRAPARSRRVLQLLNSAADTEEGRENSNGAKKKIELSS